MCYTDYYSCIVSPAFNGTQFIRDNVTTRSATRSVAWELIPFSPLSRRGLNPIKPVYMYDPDQPDDRLNITASAFNQLGQYTSSPGRRGYCYAEIAVFFPSGGRNHRQYSLRLPTEG